MNNIELIEIETMIVRISTKTYSAFTALIDQDIETHLLRKNEMQTVYDELTEYLHNLKK